MSLFKTKLSEITPELRERIKKAYQQKIESEAVLKELLSTVGYKNQTTALYRIMGLCPQCGKVPPAPGSFYCPECRDYMSRKSVLRLRAKRDSSETCRRFAQPANHPYDNDNH